MRCIVVKKVNDNYRTRYIRCGGFIPFTDKIWYCRKHRPVVLPKRAQDLFCAIVDKIEIEKEWRPNDVY